MDELDGWFQMTLQTSSVEERLEMTGFIRKALGRLASNQQGEEAIRPPKWEAMAEFVANGVVRPAARGSVDVGGLVPANLDAIHQDFDGEKGTAYEHPSGGLSLVRLDADSGNYYVLGTGISGDPSRLSEEEMCRFLPAGSRILSLRETEQGTVVQAELPQSLLGADTLKAECQISLFLRSPDVVWVAIISVLRVTKYVR